MTVTLDIENYMQNWVTQSEEVNLKCSMQTLKEK